MLGRQWQTADPALLIGAVESGCWLSGWLGLCQMHTAADAIVHFSPKPGVGARVGIDGPTWVMETDRMPTALTTFHIPFPLWHHPAHMLLRHM
jgi:hypothetical protein